MLKQVIRIVHCYVFIFLKIQSEETNLMQEGNKYDLTIHKHILSKQKKTYIMIMLVNYLLSMLF
jgi:hypothetical protein